MYIHVDVCIFDVYVCIFDVYACICTVFYVYFMIFDDTTSPHESQASHKGFCVSEKVTSLNLNDICFLYLDILSRC